MTGSENSIKILLADDHSMIRQGLSFLLEELEPDFEIFNASNLQEILEAVHSQPLDMIIIDAHFPDGNSLHIIPDIKKDYPDLKILVFTGIDEKSNVLKFLNAGANGFVSKMSEEEEISKAIAQVFETGRYLSPEMQFMLVDSLQNPSLINPLKKLTERELQIAQMYGKGMGNLEIANILDIKQNTVSTLKKRIFEKLGIDNLVELIEIVKENSL